MERLRENEIENAKERFDKRMARLRERYPEIREDQEYFIYDLVDSEGNRSEAHIHKWEKIPLQVDEHHVVHVPIWDIIETELNFRNRYPREGYSLVQALRDAGKL